MTAKNNISQEDLKRILTYNRDTGEFHWNVNSGPAKKGKRAGTNSHGYTVIGIRGKEYRAHRLAFLYEHGWIDPNKNIDHINGNRSDNRIENLRLATYGQNAWNSRPSSIKRDEDSDWKGVRLEKRTGKWVSKITVNKKTYNLGTYLFEVEAAGAYNVCAKELFGEYAYLNENVPEWAEKRAMQRKVVSDILKEKVIKNELSFRIWDNDNQKWAENAEEGIISFSNKTLNIKEKHKNFLVEQFIGMHDRFGRKIFEGDIVLCKEVSRIRPFIVERSFCHFAMTGIKKGEDFIEEFGGRLFEYQFTIKGNIHENEEFFQ